MKIGHFFIYIKEPESDCILKHSAKKKKKLKKEISQMYRKIEITYEQLVNTIIAYLKLPGDKNDFYFLLSIDVRQSRFVDDHSYILFAQELFNKLEEYKNSSWNVAWWMAKIYISIYMTPEDDLFFLKYEYKPVARKIKEAIRQATLKQLLPKGV